MARLITLITVIFLSLAGSANAMWEVTPGVLPPARISAPAVKLPTVTIPPQAVTRLSQPMARASQRINFHNGWQLEVYVDLPSRGLIGDCPSCTPAKVVHGWSYEAQVPQVQTWVENPQTVVNLLWISMFFMGIALLAQTAKIGLQITDNFRLWRRNRRVSRWCRNQRLAH